LSSPPYQRGVLALAPFFSEHAVYQTEIGKSMVPNKHMWSY